MASDNKRDYEVGYGSRILPLPPLQVKIVRYINNIGQEISRSTHKFTHDLAIDVGGFQEMIVDAPLVRHHPT